MSLINDALKKAQHQRTGNPVDLPPMPGSALGAHGVRRGKAMPAQTLTWIIAGSVAAVVVAVLITVAIVGHPSAPTQPAPRPVAAKPAAPAPAVEASPVIVAPVITVPAAKVDLSSQKLPAADSTSTVSAEPKPEPVVVAPAPAPAPTPVAESPRPLTSAGQDIRILTYIDAVRVAGIRSSGSDSKVLMNDRVYRLNDLVDYTLGIRLTKVATDGLTFTDANGTIYVKNF